MSHKFKTRDVDKVLYGNYLRRAEECLQAAKASFGSQSWNATAINSVHCCIAACDAMCIYFLGRRSAGESHKDAASLFKTIDIADEERGINTNRISRILSIKTMAEYEDRLVFKSEAEKILKDCERFFEYVETKLPSAKV